jgi:hypothetical protein
MYMRVHRINPGPIALLRGREGYQVTTVVETCLLTTPPFPPPCLIALSPLSGGRFLGQKLNAAKKNDTAMTENELFWIVYTKTGSIIRAL